MHAPVVDHPRLRVLVVEDDDDIAALMRDFLEADGFEVTWAVDGERALAELQHEPDCVLLDVMLPGQSGFELCRRIRKQSDVAVLFLSAREADADKLRGLGLGADDYIGKSATPAEVVARVHAVLRRSAGDRARSQSVLRYGRIEVDLAAREVLLDGHPVRTTAREFELLRLLAQHPREVLRASVSSSSSGAPTATAAPWPSTSADCVRSSSRTRPILGLS